MIGVTFVAVWWVVCWWAAEMLGSAQCVSLGWFGWFVVCCALMFVIWCCYFKFGCLITLVFVVDWLFVDWFVGCLQAVINFRVGCDCCLVLLIVLLIYLRLRGLSFYLRFAFWFCGVVYGCLYLLVLLASGYWFYLFILLASLCGLFGFAL